MAYQCPSSREGVKAHMPFSLGHSQVTRSNQRSVVMSLMHEDGSMGRYKSSVPFLE